MVTLMSIVFLEIFILFLKKLLTNFGNNAIIIIPLYKLLPNNGDAVLLVCSVTVIFYHKIKSANCLIVCGSILNYWVCSFFHVLFLVLQLGR